MFVREKTVNGYTYLYLVENVRENGRTKQRIIRNLGRKPNFNSVISKQSPIQWVAPAPPDVPTTFQGL